MKTINILKKTSRKFIKFIAFGIIFTSISTAIATNSKPNKDKFQANENLTAKNISDMILDWDLIYNKPDFAPSGKFCVLKARHHDCPAWASTEESNVIHGLTKINGGRSGDKGHGHGFTICCTF
jgi:hypothetical protein